jgi:hypothetical protein
MRMQFDHHWKITAGSTKGKESLSDGKFINEISLNKQSLENECLLDRRAM